MLNAFAIRRRVPEILRKRPSAMLLSVQLLEIVLYPATEHTDTGRIVLTIIGAVILLAAIWLIRNIAGHIRPMMVLALLAIGLNIVWLTRGLTSLKALQLGLEALLYFYAARCMIGYILSDRRATTDELFAAAATFTLLVWAFAQVLMLCQILQPAAFTGTESGADPRNWSQLMFLSFALFTNTGIGSVVPMTAASRAVGDIEMFVGVMYLALVVSRLVGQAANRGVNDQ